MRLQRALASLLLAATVTACNSKPSKPPPLGRAFVDPDTLPRVRIRIGLDGTIRMDGEIATLAEVEKRFAELSPKKGMVFYEREAPGKPPHPNAGEVLLLIPKYHLRMMLPNQGPAPEEPEDGGT